jgi:hypothetical protein
VDHTAVVDASTKIISVISMILLPEGDEEVHLQELVPEAQAQGGCQDPAAGLVTVAIPAAGVQRAVPGNQGLEIPHPANQKTHQEKVRAHQKGKKNMYESIISVISRVK